MSTLRVMTLRLEPEDYDQLESEATRLGVPPATLVRMYIRAKLQNGEAKAERRRGAAFDALDRLAELTTGLPHANAVQIARESREELENRLNL